MTVKAVGQCRPYRLESAPGQRHHFPKPADQRAVRRARERRLACALLIDTEVPSIREMTVDLAERQPGKSQAVAVADHAIAPGHEDVAYKVVRQNHLNATQRTASLAQRGAECLEARPPGFARGLSTALTHFDLDRPVRSRAGTRERGVPHQPHRPRT